MKVKGLVKEWKSGLENSIDEIFFDTAKPNSKVFKKMLLKIANQIENVKKISIEKRSFKY